MNGTASFSYSFLSSSLPLGSVMDTQRPAPSPVLCGHCFRRIR